MDESNINRLHPLLVGHYGLAGISEHSSVVEQLAYIQRVGGSGSICSDSVSTADIMVQY